MARSGRTTPGRPGSARRRRAPARRPAASGRAQDGDHGSASVGNRRLRVGHCGLQPDHPTTSGGRRPAAVGQGAHWSADREPSYFHGREGAVRKYIIMGPQGSGKGTQAKMLARDFDLVHISVGDIFRWHVQNRTKLGTKVPALHEGGPARPRRDGRRRGEVRASTSTTGATASSSTASRATRPRPSSSSRTTTSTR